ncbi:MAG: hypothetical protein HQ551_13580, partial [Desulfobacteraceae bacterium]|nr:hypothetical protein [Desulfobacteraceae bacterium]
NVIMTQNWYIQKENLKFIQNEIEILEDGFRLIQVYDEKTHRTGKWKFYTELKIHRSLFEPDENEFVSLDYVLIYYLLDKDDAPITSIVNNLIELMLLPTPEDNSYFIRVGGTGEIRAEDIERVRKRYIVISKK